MYYKHFKGKYYQTIGLALDTTDDSDVVVYRTLYDTDYQLFTRPVHEFFGTKTLPDGTVVPRFTEVEHDELPTQAQERVLTSISPMQITLAKK